MLSVTLFGSPLFRSEQGVVRCEMGGSGRLLACFLFHFTGQVHRREWLADTFWGDLGEERARAALNTALWRVRRLLASTSANGDKHLVTLQQEVVLEPAPFLSIDTAVLEAASRRVTAAGRLLSIEDEEAAKSAVSVSSASFLEGEEGDWILHERERLHCLFVKTAQALLVARARKGDLEEALDHGRRILHADPFRERVQRDVMLLLAANGQRAAAIRAYKSFSTLLATELAIVPTPETTRLHDEIQSGRLFNSLEEALALRFGAPASTEA